MNTNNNTVYLYKNPDEKNQFIKFNLKRLDYLLLLKK